MQKQAPITIYLPDEQAMLHWGGQLTQWLPMTCVIYLIGDLGAGKTTLVRGFLRGLGYSGIVKSPTYTLVESYHLGERYVHHFDLYRIQDVKELEFLGLPEYFGKDMTCFVEWPMSNLHASDLIVNIESLDTGRQLIVTAENPRGHEILEHFANALAT